MVGRAANEPTVKLDFGLSSAAPGLDPVATAHWPFKFNLIYSVMLNRESLTTSIVATNDGGAPFECQVLLHTYLRVKVGLAPPQPISPFHQNKQLTRPPGHHHHNHHRPRLSALHRQARHHHAPKNLPRHRTPIHNRRNRPHLHPHLHPHHHQHPRRPRKRSPPHHLRLLRPPLPRHARQPAQRSRLEPVDRQGAEHRRL